ELECIWPVNVLDIPVPVQDFVEVVPVCYNPDILEMSNQASKSNNLDPYGTTTISVIMLELLGPESSVGKCKRVRCDEMIVYADSCCSFICLLGEPSRCFSSGYLLDCMMYLSPGEESRVGVVCKLLYEVQAMFIEVMLEFRSVMPCSCSDLIIFAIVVFDLPVAKVGLDIRIERGYEVGSNELFVARTDLVGVTLILVNWKKELAMVTMSSSCCLVGAIQRTEQREVMDLVKVGVVVVRE
ncbi:16697_t:CDS:2, partial [Gigaspora rosea]